MKHPIKTPDGFEIINDRGPFADVNGPFYRFRKNENAPATTFGFLPEERHANSLGFMHGGMISTLLDGVMAQAIFEAHQRRLVTLSLNIEFKNTIPIGKWIQADVELKEIENNVIGCAASLMSNDRICATATGTFRLFRR